MLSFDMANKGDRVQVYMWESSDPFKHLAWNGELMTVIKRLKRTESEQLAYYAVVTHPDWLEPLKSEGVEVPMQYIRRYPACDLDAQVAQPIEVPQVGDKVMVFAGIYEQWYSEQVASFPYGIRPAGRKQYSRNHQEFVTRYDPMNFPWGDAFKVKQITDEIAVIASTERYRVPVKCLGVFDSQNQSEVQSA